MGNRRWHGMTISIKSMARYSRDLSSPLYWHSTSYECMTVTDNWTRPVRPPGGATLRRTTSSPHRFDGFIPAPSHWLGGRIDWLSVWGQAGTCCAAWRHGSARLRCVVVVIIYSTLFVNKIWQHIQTRKPSCRWQTRATLAKSLHGLRKSSGVVRCIASLPIDSLPMVSYYVLCSNCVCEMRRFGYACLLKLPCPWNPGQGSLKVIESDTIR